MFSITREDWSKDLAVAPRNLNLLQPTSFRELSDAIFIVSACCVVQLSHVRPGTISVDTDKELNKFQVELMLQLTSYKTSLEFGLIDS